jgi:hypothetical protein
LLWLAQSIVNSAEQKIESLGTKVQEYSQDYSKLQVRSRRFRAMVLPGFVELVSAADVESKASTY